MARWTPAPRPALVAVIGIVLVLIGVALSRVGGGVQDARSSGSGVTTSMSFPTTSAVEPSSTAPPAGRPPGGELESVAGAHGPAQLALAEARERWQSSKPARGYVWSYDNLCRCSPRKLEVQVDGAGAVTGVRALDGSSFPMEPGQGRTVEAAFAEVQAAIAADVDRIRVRFDPVLGFPSTYVIDPSGTSADDESGLSLIAFSPRV